MVSIRAFTSALVFILVLVGKSSARPHGTETTLAPDHGSGLEPARKNLAKSGKEVSVNSRLEARKMMLKEGSDREDSANVAGYSDQSFGKSGHRSSEKAILKRKQNHHRRGKTKMGGFSAFSADYHVPKPHPPKHN
ncbi:hypothetical protein V6N13_109368 [Hibiscus sabdariffa]|uniref:Secreted protein n=1 Tax=Hibiscus sabdariffa TaxID=183260 RepID=A0ABR2FQ28_9ROSI